MKAYTQEAYSDQVKQQLLWSTACFISSITWVEMHAAFDRKQRTSQVNAAEVVEALARLQSEWANLQRTAVDEPLIKAAGQLASRFALRANDAVQLASAQRVHQEAGYSMLFCCFDEAMNAAAVGLGMRILVAQD